MAFVNLRVLLVIALLLMVSAGGVSIAQETTTNLIVSFEQLEIYEDNEWSDEPYAAFVQFRFQLGIPLSLHVSGHPITRAAFRKTTLGFNRFLAPQTEITIPPEFLGTIVLFMERDSSDGLEMVEALQETIVLVLREHLAPLTDLALLNEQPDVITARVNLAKDRIKDGLAVELEKTYRDVKDWWRDEDDIVGVASVLYSSLCGRRELNTVPNECYLVLPLAVDHAEDVEGKYRTSGTISQAFCITGQTRQVSCTVSGQQSVRTDTCVDGAWVLGVCRRPTSRCTHGGRTFEDGDKIWIQNCDPGGETRPGIKGWQQHKCQNGQWVEIGKCYGEFP